MELIRQEFMAMQSEYVEDVKNEIWQMDGSIAGALAISYLQDAEAEAEFIEDLTIKYEKQNTQFILDQVLERVGRFLESSGGRISCS